MHAGSEHGLIERLQVNDIEFWHDVTCAHILETTCTEYDPSFHFDLALSRHSDVQISRVRSVRHTWKRTEKQVRHSSCDQLVVYLQSQGVSAQSQDGRELYLRAGEITCTDTTRPVEMRLAGPFEQVLLHIPRNLVVNALGSTEPFTTFELSAGNPLGSVVAPFLRNVGSIFDQVSPSSSNTLIDNAVSLVLTLLAERSSKRLEDPRWKQTGLRFRAEEMIRRQSQKRELTPRTVAAALNVSLRYLQDIFHAVGTTPSELIWDSRLRTSERDLSNSILGSLNITEIAYRNGFTDTAHFSRRFKERYGMSPREFRLHHKATQLTGDDGV